MSSPRPASNVSLQPSAARVGKYLMLDLLGEGAFGKVRLAVDETDGQQYAMKIMEKSHIKANELTLQVRREIAVMKAMRHPNIVNLHEVLTSSKNLYMVMDLVTGGELFDAVADSGKLPEHIARLYFQQLVDGIHYCHTRRVYHRDLKPENLLLTGDKQTIKITDFGLSSIKATNASSELLHTIMGSPHYIAPEIITSAAKGYDGSKVDVWASGIILFGMLAGFLPFDEPNNSDLYRSIVHNPIPFPPHFSYDAATVIRDLLQKDPNSRPTMEQVKHYAWFKINYKPAVPEPDTAPQRRAKNNKGKLRKAADRLNKHRKKDAMPPPPKSLPAFQPNDAFDPSENDVISTPISAPVNVPPRYTSAAERWKPENRGDARAVIGRGQSSGALPALERRVAAARVSSSDSSNRTAESTSVASDSTRRVHSHRGGRPYDSVDRIDGMQVSTDGIDMTDTVTYVETPSLARKGSTSRDTPFAASIDGHPAVAASSVPAVAADAPLQDRASAPVGGDRKLSGRGHYVAKIRKMSARLGRGSSGIGTTFSRKSVDIGQQKQSSSGVEELTPTNRDQKHTADTKVKQAGGKEDSEKFVSPVSVNVPTNEANVFDRDSSRKPTARRIAELHNSQELGVQIPGMQEAEKGKRNCDDDQGDPQVKCKPLIEAEPHAEGKPRVEGKMQPEGKPKADGTRTGNAGEGHASSLGGGIFKPVKALFKPLAKTLMKGKTHEEVAVNEPDITRKPEWPCAKAEEEADWTVDSGDVFADVESDCESLRWRMDDSGVSGVGGGGWKIVKRGSAEHQPASMAAGCSKEGGGENSSNIFASLNSELRVKLAPLEDHVLEKEVGKPM